jgi:hypothetical protein
LNISLLYQFTGQSESLASSDPALFDQYLTATDQAMSGLDSVLSDLGVTLGLEGDALQNFKSQVAQQVAGFFSDLSQFVSQAHQKIDGTPSVPDSPPPAGTPTLSPPRGNPGVTAL